jgi:hypothetical protein
VPVAKQHESWKVVVVVAVAVHQMVHPSESSSTFLWFLARSPRHDMQQHDTPYAADGASVAAGQTLQQTTLPAAAVDAVDAVAAANELADAVVAAATPCVVGSDDFHDLFLYLLMWPQGAAAALVLSPLRTERSGPDGDLLSQPQQTSVAQHDFLSLLQISAAH